MSHAKFMLRGVVEGFYGFYYTHRERIDLLQFLGRHGYNIYVYAPKNDRYHRDQWRDPYPAHAAALFLETIQAAQQNGIRFAYAIAPGTSIQYSSPAEFAAIQQKFTYFYEMGVRDFSLLLDDIHSDFDYAEDRARYDSYAQAHADLCNRLYAWLKSVDAACELSMCPTDYADTPPFSDYSRTLGAQLHPDILAMYTGVEVCSRAISAEYARAYGEVMQRKPLIWDNYPVNDGGMAADLHLGPIEARDPRLYSEVSGILVNPMNQPEASKIALATYADYLEDPEAYDAQKSWRKALVEVAGDEYADALQLLGENALKSCLKTPNAQRLEGLTAAAITALQSDQNAPDDAALEALDQYLTLLKDASYTLATDLQNEKLRAELLPWLELCDLWRRLGKNVVAGARLMRAGLDFQEQKRQVEQTALEITRHPKRLMGTSLMPLAEWLLNQPSP